MYTYIGEGHGERSFQSNAEGRGCQVCRGNWKRGERGGSGREKRGRKGRGSGGGRGEEGDDDKAREGGKSCSSWVHILKKRTFYIVILCSKSTRALTSENTFYSVLLMCC
jgi:hypothetical protein